MIRPRCVALFLFVVAFISAAWVGVTPHANADALQPIDNLIALGRFHEALPLIQKAIKNDPTNPVAHSMYAKINMNLSRFAACKENLAKCAALDPEGSKQIVAALSARLAYWECDLERARKLLVEAGDFEPPESKFAEFLNTSGMKLKKTQHFQIYVEDALAEQGGLEAAGTTLEQVYEVYAKIFDFKSDPIYSPVYLFATWESFRTFRSRIYSENIPRNRQGTYVPGIRANLVHCDPQGQLVVAGGITDTAIRNIYLQGFYQFCEMYCPGLPPWFERGCGYYASQSVFEKGKPKLGTFCKTDPDPGERTKYEVLKEAFKNSSLLPLNSLLTMGQKEFNDPTDRRDSVNAAHAWGFVHFLLHSKKFPQGKKLLAGFFMAMREGNTPEEAFAKTFGKQDLKKLDLSVQDFIKNM